TNLPNISYYNNNEYNFQKPYSETTAKAIDDEAIRMIAEQYDRAKAILTEHKEGHNQLAQLLIEREVIFAEDVEKIFGKRQWVSRSQEILEETNSKAESSTGSEPAKDAEGHNDTESTAGTENTENSTTPSSTDDQNQ
ncbi:MAG: cell division protein FtsH, partial [Prevotella sp.]